MGSGINFCSSFICNLNIYKVGAFPKKIFFVVKIQQEKKFRQKAVVTFGLFFAEAQKGFWEFIILSLVVHVCE